MLTVAKNSFIVYAGLAHWFDQNLSLFHCTFDGEHYNDELFNQFEIEFPESLYSAVVKRRAEFLAGRYCAKRALEQLGIFNTQIPIGEHRTSVWPVNIVGSISHSNGLAIAAIANRPTIAGIGIDIENIVAPETLEKTQQFITSKSELDLISTDLQACTQLFTIIFSVKESFFKAAYPMVGNYFGFDAVSLVQFNQANGSVLLEINRDLSNSLKAGLQITGHFRLLPDGKVVTLVELYKNFA